MKVNKLTDYFSEDYLKKDYTYIMMIINRTIIVFSVVLFILMITTTLLIIVAVNNDDFYLQVENYETHQWQMVAENPYTLSLYFINIIGLLVISFCLMFCARFHLLVYFRYTKVLKKAFREIEDLIEKSE